MLIHTRDNQQVNVSPDSILEFARPVLGFESYRHFALIPASNATPLHWLQCIEERALAFPVVSAETLGVSYASDDDSRACVRAVSSADITHWVILVLPADGSAPRANLRAPIVVNRAGRLAAQVIMREEYPVSSALTNCAPRELALAR